jgi:tRNA(Ile)-lysidine synthase TilS/MesJ
MIVTEWEKRLLVVGKEIRDYLFLKELWVDWDESDQEYDIVLTENCVNNVIYSFAPDTPTPDVISSIEAVLCMLNDFNQ